MKKVIVICVVLCIVALSIVAFSLCLPKDPIENGALVINGKTLDGSNAIIYDGYAELPLLEVMSNIGFQIEWKDANVADIKLDDKVYVLNLSEKTLIENGKTFDYLEIPPGSRNYSCEMHENELYLDSNTFHIIMRMMGLNIRMDVDYSSATVTIEIADYDIEKT